MDQVVFVPLSDDMLFDHPELINGPLVPYAPGMNVDPARADEAVQSSPMTAQEEREAADRDAFGNGRRAHR